MLTPNRSSVCCCIALLLVFSRVQAAVKPNVLFSDGAVLQRDIPLPVWGTADDGERVTATLGEAHAATVAKDGKWRLSLPAMKAGGPYELVISGATNTTTVKNVMIGEVWVCSGQSNMEMPLIGARNFAAIKAASTDPQLRMFHAGGAWGDKASSELQGSWYPSEPTVVSYFSAAGYVFGRDLRKALGVPVGMIEVALSGTVAEAWTSRQSLSANPDLKYLVDKYTRDLDLYQNQIKAFQEKQGRYEAEKKQYDLDLATAKAANAVPLPAPPTAPAPPPNDPAIDANRPGHLFNGLIVPLAPYPIRGVLWYQGESNLARAYEYKTLLPLMIADWRRLWNPELPFLLVQLPPNGAAVAVPGESAWAELREAQRLTALHGAKIGLAVTTDISDEHDLHPTNKEPLGDRLALLARGMVYGERIDYMGPTFDMATAEADHLIVAFKNTAGHLAAEGDVKGFEVAGDDRKWHVAAAVIRGDTVSLSSPEVAHPVAARYCWADYPSGNLKGATGLGAGPFRSDNWDWSSKPH